MSDHAARDDDVGEVTDPFDVMALQLRATVRAAARHLAYEAPMALRLPPAREGQER